MSFVYDGHYGVELCLNATKDMVAIRRMLTPSRLTRILHSRMLAHAGVDEQRWMDGRVAVDVDCAPK